ERGAALAGRAVDPVAADVPAGRRRVGHLLALLLGASHPQGEGHRLDPADLALGGSWARAAPATPSVAARTVAHSPRSRPVCPCVRVIVVLQERISTACTPSSSIILRL